MKESKGSAIYYQGGEDYGGGRGHFGSGCSEKTSIPLKAKKPIENRIIYSKTKFAKLANDELVCDVEFALATYAF